jgi:hypothetical protein
MTRTRSDIEHLDGDDEVAEPAGRSRKRRRSAPRQRTRLRSSKDTPSKEAAESPRTGDPAAEASPVVIFPEDREGGSGGAGDFPAIAEARPDVVPEVPAPTLVALDAPARVQSEMPMDEDLKNNVKSRDTWVRLAYMLLFGVIFYVGQFVVGLVALIQFFHKLVTGAAHARLVVFGDGLGTYYHEVISFLSFRTERIPFPFSPWPSPPAAGTDAAEAEPLRKTG